MTGEQTGSAAVQPGYEIPRPTQDPWVARLFEENGLGTEPSMRDIEPIATRLLGSAETIFDAASLVFGVTVDTDFLDQNPKIRRAFGGIIFLENPAERFTLLLMAESVYNKKEEVGNRFSDVTSD